MSAPPYMKLYWGDYFRDTRRLNRLHHSAYLLILGEMWIQGGKLPADDATLAEIALCTTAEWDEIKGVVMTFFRVSRGKITQKRLSAELAKYEDTKRKRKVAGRNGGLASHGKESGNSQAIAKQKPTKPEPEPEPEKKKPSVSKKPKTLIPANWLPSVDDIAYAATKGMGPRELEREAEKFSDWHRAKGSEWVDWSATWRTWVRRWVEDRDKARPKVVGFV
jgi:uncharacterized protein YdaU (DUF1376 family)